MELKLIEGDCLTVAIDIKHRGMNPLVNMSNSINPGRGTEES